MYVFAPSYLKLGREFCRLGICPLAERPVGENYVEPPLVHVRASVRVCVDFVSLRVARGPKI